MPLCFATGAPVNVSVTVFVEFIGDIDEINMVCLLCCYVEVSQSDFIPRCHEIYQHKSAQTIRYHISKVQNVLLVRVIYISTCKFFKTLEKCKLPGVGALLTNPLGHPLVFWQPLSQVLSPSVGTSKRESWERGWCFESDGVLVFKLTTHSERFFFSDRNIIKYKNEMSRFVFREAIELTGFFFIYLNRNLPQSCTFVSTGWTPVCNITIQGTPRDLPSILKCSNLSGFPTLTSLASRMVSNTISQILMRWSGYGQMDQCCTVWGEWGMDMSIYSPGGQVTGLSSGKYVPLASHNSYPIIGHSVAKYRHHPIHFWQNIVFTIQTKYLSVYASILLTRSSWNELTHWLNLMKSKSVFIFNSLPTSIFWYPNPGKCAFPWNCNPIHENATPSSGTSPLAC